MKVEIIRSYEFSKEEIDKARNDWELTTKVDDQSIAKTLAIQAFEQDKSDVREANFRYAK